MPGDGGRKRAPEWSEVIAVEAENKKSRTECKYCRCRVSAKIERIRTHLAKCNERYYHERDLADKTLSLKNMVVMTDLCTVSLGLNEKQTIPKREVPIKQTQRHQVVQKTPSADSLARTTPEQKRCIDEKITKFFSVNKIDLQAANSEQYFEMIEALRPGYNPPNRFELLGRFLDSQVKWE